MSRETLSACMDGAHDDMDAALDAACRDTDARATWSRYHLIGDAMRARTPCVFADAGFADRVRASLAEETAPTAPRVVPMFGRSGSTRGRRAVQRRTTRWAVAASVAAVALVSVGLLAPGGESEPVIVKKDLPLPASTVAARGGIQPAVQTTASGAQPAVTGQTMQWSQIQPDAARQLNGYLINHTRYRAAPGVGGTLGFARVASVNGDATDVAED